jgi:hypothetical protein
MFASFYAWPFVRINPNTSNIILFVSFVFAFLVSGWQFFRKILYSSPTEKSIERDFIPID